MSQTYHTRKEKGLCTRCGGKLDDAHSTTCNKCKALERARHRNYMSSLPSKELLEYKMKRSNSANERLHRLRSEGKCIRCMGPSPDKWTCASCRQKIKDKRDAAKKGGSRDDTN